MIDKMTSYERIITALQHCEPDRVPFDLGGSVLTGMNVNTYRKLRSYLGMPEVEITLCDPFQQLATIDDDMVERLRVDVRALDPGPAENSPLQTDLITDGDYYSLDDEWGITWKMPVEGGHYFDMQKHPLSGDVSISDIENHPWPDPLDKGRFSTMKQRADHIVNEEKRAYILGRNSAGIFEVALWTRGFENFFMDLAADPDLADALLDIITEIKMKYWERALEVVGDSALIISEADDLATQRGLMVSPEMYKRFISPRHKRLFDHIKKKASGKVYVFYHSCGATRELIPTLIEEGIDILNPVQVSADGMDTAELKRDFGKDITFWGGGVDTQQVLPRGTTEQVREEVKRRIEDLAPGGGFVFNTVHNVQSDVPPENYMAMWEALQEYGGY
jgi:uroporphyrinogen decarboxylase